MANKYAFEGYNPELMAKAAGVSLPISMKQCVEICTALRKKPLDRAKNILEDAIAEKKAIPYRRYNRNIGHKPKMGPGRFSPKACMEVLTILKSAESNAQFKGLNPGNMIVKHICAHKASTPWHSGRVRGIKMKRSHVEVVLEETKKSEKKAEKKTAKSTKVKSVGSVKSAESSKPVESIKLTESTKPIESVKPVSPVKSAEHIEKRNPVKEDQKKEEKKTVPVQEVKETKNNKEQSEKK